jgi:conjugative transfer signal peptidase TraF
MNLPRLTRVEAALFALAILAWTSQARPHPLLVNETGSLPRGLYIWRPDLAPNRGAVVALRPPSAAAPYLAVLGAPEGVRLLKRVAALSGDRVCAHPGSVTLRDRSLVAHTTDRRGRPLPAWTGCGPLPTDQVFLLGDTADSFDSRYFGPVRLSELDGVYGEVFTW